MNSQSCRRYLSFPTNEQYRGFYTFKAAPVQDDIAGLITVSNQQRRVVC